MEKTNKSEAQNKQAHNHYAMMTEIHTDLRDEEVKKEAEGRSRRKSRLRQEFFFLFFSFFS